MKIVIIGAGSSSFGRGIIADVLACPELEQKECFLFLVDSNPESLQTMFQFAQALKEFHRRKIRIEATVDRKEALVAADYVITSVARHRYSFWSQDFFLPLTFGFRQIYGENGGPGAAFHTLRSLHLMLPSCQDMENLCPQALLLNFTNPESRVCLGIKKLTRIRAVGLGHGPKMTLRIIARILDQPEENLCLTVGGLNHFHWVLTLKERKTDQNLYPQLREKIEEKPKLLPPLARELFFSFGLLPFPVDSHIGEYIGQAYYICGVLPGLKMLARPIREETSSA
ncbi:MAG: alpha-glucosidase/alpha-galactosidase, partial [Candidatus Omnitrophica bacterium]|nr:alpha-glucosidase/alpha-galactosidase [Candidatus Omnitrophota bacterium]